MTKRRIITTFVLIIALASFFRLYNITSIPPGLFIDEAMNGNNALEVVSGAPMQVFYQENNGREGLFINALVPLLAFLPNEPWVLRLPAAIAGILTVVGVFALGKELYNDKIGLLASFLLSTSFWHIDFSRIALRAIFAPLILTWAFYALLKAIRTTKKNRGILLAAFSGCIFGLGFYSYTAFRITPLLLLTFYLFFATSPHFRRRMWTFLTATFVTTLPLALYFVQNPKNFVARLSIISVMQLDHPITQILINIKKMFLMFVIKGDPNWLNNISGDPEFPIVISILFFFGIGLGVFFLLRKKADANGKYEEINNSLFAFALLLSWLIIANIPAILSNEGLPHALRAILVPVPVVLLAAYATTWIFEKLWKRNMQIIGYSILVVACTCNAYVTYFVVWANKPEVKDIFFEQQLKIGNQIMALPADEEKYILVPPTNLEAKGVSLNAQPVMFVTNSYTLEMRKQKHITYLLTNQNFLIPSDTPKDHIFILESPFSSPGQDIP